jgi:hypothetical protein
MMKHQILIEFDTKDEIPEARFILVWMNNVIVEAIRKTYESFLNSWSVDDHYVFLRGRSLYDIQEEKRKDEEMMKYG